MRSQVRMGGLMSFERVLAIEASCDLSGLVVSAGFCDLGVGEA